VTRLVILVAAALLAASAAASELGIASPWIRLLPGGAPAGGYFTLRNGAQRPVELVGVSSTAYGSVMMHRTTEAGGMARMQPVDRIEVPAGGEVAFAPGGYHLMLMQPARNIAVGDRIPVTLEFADGRRLTREFDVRGPTGK